MCFESVCYCVVHSSRPVSVNLRSVSLPGVQQSNNSTQGFLNAAQRMNFQYLEGLAGEAERFSSEFPMKMVKDHYTPTFGPLRKGFLRNSNEVLHLNYKPNGVKANVLSSV